MPIIFKLKRGKKDPIHTHKPKGANPRDCQCGVVRIKPQDSPVFGKLQTGPQTALPHHRWILSRKWSGLSEMPKAHFTPPVWSVSRHPCAYVTRHGGMTRTGVGSASLCTHGHLKATQGQSHSHGVGRFTVSQQSEEQNAAEDIPAAPPAGLGNGSDWRSKCGPEVCRD